MKKVPFVTLDKLQEITAQFPTPFHLYDEKGIRENAKAVKDVYKRQDNAGFLTDALVRERITAQGFPVKEIGRASCRERV